MNVKWQAMSTRSVVLKRWGDEFAVYDETSGDTHLVSSLAGELLCAVDTASPRNNHELVAAMAELLNEPPDQEFTEEVHAILLQLASMNLLRYSPS